MQDFRLISRRTDPPLAGADQPLAEARDTDGNLCSSVSFSARFAKGEPASGGGGSANDLWRKSAIICGICKCYFVDKAS